MGNTFGLLATQFLSLFNDYTFKQIVLLTILGSAGDEQASAWGDWQGIAIIVFAAPFLLFAGHAGSVSDSTGRRRVIVVAKAAEILIMLGAWLVFSLKPEAQFAALFIVLFAMATQSAYLAPAKYGIVIDLFGSTRVAAINGWMQMLGYLAIVAGAVMGGLLVSLFGDHPIAMGGCLVCVAIAGWMASLLIPQTSVSSASPPDTKIRWTPFLSVAVWKSISANRMLGDAFVAYAFFWLIAGMYQPLVNAFGKRELQWGDIETSLLLSLIAIGIAVGCGIAGQIRDSGLRHQLMPVVAWSLIVTQMTLSLWPLMLGAVPIIVVIGLLLVSGILTGMIVLPLHVLIQVRSPFESRGRILAAQNVVNYLAVLASGVVYQTLRMITEAFHQAPSLIFLLVAVGSIPSLILLRPREDRLLRWRP